MDYPVDKDQVRLMAAGGREPVVDRATGEQRRDRDGRLLWRVSTVLFFGGSAEVVWLRSPDIADDIEQGCVIRATSLVVSPWAMGDRSGVSYRADRIDRGGQQRRGDAAATREAQS